MAIKPTAEYVEFPIRENQPYCARLLLALSVKAERWLSQTANIFMQI